MKEDNKNEQLEYCESILEIKQLFFSKFKS